MYIEPNGLYLVPLTSDNLIRVFYQCPGECVTCSFPNNCTSCVDTHVLNGATCVERPSQCVNNRYLYENICEQYCHKMCKTCNQTWTDCYECSEYYTKNNEGKCVIESQSLDFARKARGFFNLIRRKGFKFFFFALDDLWLYDFH